MLLAAALSGCGIRSNPTAEAPIIVAAATNLTDVFGPVGRAFQARTGIPITFSYGSTAQLAQQLDNGAPFDVFAAADTEHIDSLISKGRLVKASRAVYALGQLALWIPQGEQRGIRTLSDLKASQVQVVAIAQPDLAPYGHASIEALRNAHLWEAVQPKVVYSNTISQTRQMASSGNADAAFTAYSLVLHDQGRVLKIDPGLYRPIEQALGIAVSSARMEAARQFRAFLLNGEGRSILENSGYLPPPP
jgi:molybdate transport system substrate-binding protein